MAATTDPVDGPSRSVEIELKFDVDDDTPLPVWDDLPGVSSVGAGELRSLDARYLDTADLALARAGVALRRRTGGPDEGWHIKGPLVDGARTELHWPLGSSVPGETDVVPEPLLEALGGMTDAAPAALRDLHPSARVRNERTAYALRDAAGGVVAEFVDDRVSARDEGSGTERGWREWEFELGSAAPTSEQDRAALFAAVTAAAHAAGARAAASGSKLARALGR